MSAATDLPVARRAVKGSLEAKAKSAAVVEPLEAARMEAEEEAAAAGRAAEVTEEVAAVAAWVMAAAVILTVGWVMAVAVSFCNTMRRAPGARWRSHLPQWMGSAPVRCLLQRVRQSAKRRGR